MKEAMFYRIAVALIHIGLAAPAVASDELPQCTTANLLAYKSLVEELAVKTDACNRTVAESNRWVECDLPDTTADIMPWINRCLRERIVAAYEQADAYDPASSGISQVLALQNETLQLTGMKDSWALYQSAMMLRIKLQTEFATRDPSSM